MGEPPPLNLLPSAYFKLSLDVPPSGFSHSVDMAPLGGNYFGFVLKPTGAGVGELSVRLDFDVCEGQDMLSLGPLDFHLFNPLASTGPFHIDSPSSPLWRGCRTSVFTEVARYAMRISPYPNPQEPLPCNYEFMLGGWEVNQTSYTWAPPCRRHYESTATLEKGGLPTKVAPRIQFFSSVGLAHIGPFSWLEHLTVIELYFITPNFLCRLTGLCHRRLQRKECLEDGVLTHGPDIHRTHSRGRWNRN